MSRKIKVLHIITRLDKGGSAENTFLTVKGLDKERFEVSLMCGPADDPRQERRTQVEECGIPFIFLPQLVRNIHLVRDPVALFKIYRFLKKEKFDMVHTHTSKAGLLGRFAAKLAKTPLIIHTPHGHVFYGYFGPLKTRLFILLERLAGRITDRIIALTQNEKEDYTAQRIAGKDRCVVIPSGIELAQFRELSQDEKAELKKEIGIPENFAVVGTAGRLVPVKDPGSLIEASRHIIARFPETCFLFAGDGPLKKYLQKKAVSMGIEENIFFLGWRDDVARILSLLDIFCLPSLNEGMGRVLAEAMALGKPIVASRAGGIPDLITHGRNGFLVPPQNPEELAGHIQRLLEDKGLREKMGREGQDTVSELTHETMVQKIENMYQELMTDKTSPT